MATLEQIRREALRYQPFLSRALYSLTPVASSRVPASITCDQNWNVYYNPKEIESYNKDQTESAGFRMCREVARLLQSHPQRIARLIPKAGHAVDHYLWIASMASTALANELIAKDESRYREDVFLPTDLPGCGKFTAPEKVLENVYRTLCHELPAPDPPEDQPSGGDDKQKEEGQQQQQQQQQQQSEQDSCQEPPEESQELEQKTRHEQKARHEQQADTFNRELPKSMQCPDPEKSGSATDGQKRPWERDPNDESPVNEGEIRQSVAQAVEHGDGAASCLKRWAKEQLIQGRMQPPRDLMSILKEFSETQAGYELKRFDGRNRRQGPVSEYNRQEIYLPHYYAPKFDLLIVLDTSGSMDYDTTTIAMMYIASVLESLGIHEGSHFYTGDVRPEYHGMLNVQRAREAEFSGGGGTDMPVVIRTALNSHQNQGRPCNLVLCVTDGYSSWNMEPLEVPLVIAITPGIDTSARRKEEEFYYERQHDSRSSYRLPEFAEVTFIENQVPVSS